MAGERSELLKEAQQFAENILNNELAPEIKYHSVDHTREVVRAALEIARKTGVSSEELEIVELAAWFHDLGYKRTIENHEEVSAEIALDFLSEKGYDDERAAKVVGCIMATKMPQNPKNDLQAILCDADLAHLAEENYCDKADLLQEELRRLNGKNISDIDWYRSNQRFITEHEFFTGYAKEKFTARVKKNLKKVNEKLMEMKNTEDEVSALKAQVEKLKVKIKKVKEVTPTRGVETMFRLTSKNHLELSAMADTKANIMISVNSIILSVLVSVLFRKLEEYPHLIIPAMLMTVVCLSTIVFAILATLPNVSKGTFTEEDIQNKRTNLLFFGNFHRMEMGKYEWGMKEMMKDADYLYTSLIRDIYFLGVVLGKKYRLLRISYTIFMFGFVVAVLAFGVAEVFFKAPYPY
ncbi:Pycsar system effector family protein [Marinoscillum sp. 108]|uniref:Pycsar system effector family protein n=1 Tax=Marinoscillum luteum TaxID=861051 RepID=A0ABW7NDQ6_9BACT|nr:Pycsar system effector family protein [Marinoscillum sp. 108]VXD13941.1 putative metal-dependent HD superfamily phosphohydrolase [Marinoscillum sp. 108]